MPNAGNKRSLIWHHLSVPSESTLSPDSAVAALVRWREYLHISYFKCSFFVLKGLHSCKQTYILLCFYPFILLISCSTSIKPERACLFKNTPAHKPSPLWLVSSLSIVFLHKLCWCFMQQCSHPGGVAVSLWHHNVNEVHDCGFSLCFDTFTQLFWTETWLRVKKSEAYSSALKIRDAKLILREFKRCHLHLSSQLSVGQYGNYKVTW